MSGFSADWLALREPFDAAARAPTLVAELARHLDAGTPAAPRTIVDLGAGAGSNLRYLAPLLGGVQRWLLVDHDEALLAAALARTRAWASDRGARCEQRGAALGVRGTDLDLTVICERRDLANLGALALPTSGLVTAAALLDLVSREWLEALAARCRAAHAAVCFALTYDGRTTCTPPEPEDSTVLALFNRHQLGDKGFGPALGPAAADAATEAFRAHGYTVRATASDWRIGPQAGAIQQALLDGWHSAARELAPERRDSLARWRERRSEHIAGARAAITVGHVDLVGWL